MTFDELRKKATAPNDIFGGTVEHVYLVIPRKRLPQGANIRLAGKFGPFGRLCNVKEIEGKYDYECVAVFKSAEILQFLDKAQGRT